MLDAKAKWDFTSPVCHCSGKNNRHLIIYHCTCLMSGTGRLWLSVVTLGGGIWGGHWSKSWRQVKDWLGPPAGKSEGRRVLATHTPFFTIFTVTGGPMFMKVTR